MSTRPRDCALLALVLCVAAVVRLWGIDFGLPQTHCRPDETLVVQPAFEYFTGDLNPHFFRYPSLFSYVVSATAAASYGIGRVTGHFTSLADLRLEYLIDPSRFYLIARGWSALFGVATVWMVYRIARRWYGRDTALAAALILALCHLHVRDSHFGVTDVAQTFFITFAFERIQAWWDSGALRCAIAAGAATGLAASTKYVGGLMVLPFAVALVLRTDGSERQVSRKLRAASAFALFAALAFVVGTPYSLLDFTTFWQQLTAEFQHLGAGQGLDLGSGWTRHPAFSLLHGMGPPLLIASLAGALALVRNDARRAALLLAFPLVYFALAGSGSTVFVRYAIPWTPFFAVSSAFLITSALQYIGASWPAWRRSAALAVVTLLCLSPSIAELALSDIALAHTDSRELASQWITAHVAPGSEICQISQFGRVQLPVAPPARELARNLYAEPPDNLAARAARMRSSPWRREHGDGYVACRFRESDGRFLREDSTPCEAPRYILVSSSPLSLYDRVPPALQALLASDYDIAWQIPTGARSVAENHYDLIDAFYLPFVAAARVERPGPDLALYELRLKR